jgi:hypothetical protein
MKYLSYRIDKTIYYRGVNMSCKKCKPQQVEWQINRKAVWLCVVFILTLGTSSCVGWYNTIKVTTDEAKRLSGKQPEPVWQSTLQGREVDLLNFLPDGNILVETWWFNEGLDIVREDTRNLPQDLILIDGKSGNVLWKIPRNFSSAPG